ncbi:MULTISPECIES: DUF484 family protein [unclassified Haematospirillum]|uniref:DUF484 family protein n=1 Tax=unclassified Haematospirillum TaxID=2622088 RepID=UPI00143A37DD|nr:MULTISPECIES: DUF484 family protein [unclassified Haematospirillum]NKD55352.1 DUF484 family protein [Haematospirillum sp. H4890]NKD75571.1 DUF484 family protein [Haematospirillum sp. H4485]NKD88345.1 DUF484 family protein [Haematospirillum sp. 15-248]
MNPGTRDPVPQPLSPSDVELFLKSNPDFLMERPELMASLLPDRDLGAGVVDFQARALKALRTEADELRAGAREVIHTARENMSLQNATHHAVVALLGAESLQDLMIALTQDVPMMVHVDLAALICEPGLPLPLAGQVIQVPHGEIDRLLGDSDVRLRPFCGTGAALYGEASALIRSDALVRLRHSGHPPAVLALASRDTGTFEPGQGTELLVFLATVLDFCLIRWLTRD